MRELKGKLLSLWRQLKDLRQTKPRRYALYIGLIGFFVLLWSGMLWWGFFPANSPDLTIKWKDTFRGHRRAPVVMPFRKRGYLEDPPRRGTFPMSSVDFDRG